MIDQEQEWIAKYRAALSATPARPSRVEAFVAGLKGIIQEFVSAIGKASHHKTFVQMDRKPSEQLPCPKVPQAATPRLNLQRRTSAPHARKRHPSGQPRRRKAS